jgi:3-oxoacyl-[acyl-carrier protein] reductase
MTTEGNCKNRLQGRIAIITGAGKGIGYGIAKTFAEEGAQVILVSRTEADLKKGVDAIAKVGGKASYIVADVTKAQDMAKMAESTLKKHGRIDILVHNAGIYPVANIKDMTLENWNNVINTNLTSTYLVVKACLPSMTKQKYGRIVFTSSISGPRVGWPGGSHYTASKAGMNGFMKTIAIELAKENITVNTVEPGNVISEGLEELGKEHMDKITSGIPMGRLATVEEIAYAHLFLASDEARYITGQSIIVDGGQILPESDQHMHMHVH